MKNSVLSVNLPAPDLPQLTPAHYISMNDIAVGGGVFIIIGQYEDAATGDYIKVFWDETPIKEIAIASVADDFPLVIRVTADISQGGHTTYYQATDVSGNTNESERITLNIGDVPPDVIYPAPVFIDAVSDVITQKSITDNNGTHVHIAPYSKMAVNDVVTLFWSGFSSDENLDVFATYPDLVTESNLTTGITFLIPADKFTNLDKGTVSAYYQVRRNGEIVGISASSSASVDLSGGNDLTLHLTTGAANTDYNSIHLYPFNQGVLKGPAGASVEISVSGASVVIEESGSANYNVNLDEEGIARFRVRSAMQGLVTVNAFEKNHPDVAVKQNMTFGPYTKGNGGIEYLNYSTGAPADGVTPCSIYLKTTPSSGDQLKTAITRVRVILTSASGAAVVDGYSGNTADILLNSDQSAEIDIVNTVTESVTVELSLPESSGSINRKDVVFVNV